MARNSSWAFRPSGLRAVTLPCPGLQGPGFSRTPWAQSPTACGLLGPAGLAQGRAAEVPPVCAGLKGSFLLRLRTAPCLGGTPGAPGSRTHKDTTATPGLRRLWLKAHRFQPGLLNGRVYAGSRILQQVRPGASLLWGRTRVLSAVEADFLSRETRAVRAGRGGGRLAGAPMGLCFRKVSAGSFPSILLA